MILQFPESFDTLYTVDQSNSEGHPNQLNFRELRERAQKELGPKYDLRKFHDEMLDGGTLPLDMLDARTDKWTAQQKAK